MRLGDKMDGENSSIKVVKGVQSGSQTERCGVDNAVGDVLLRSKKRARECRIDGYVDLRRKKRWTRDGKVAGSVVLVFSWSDDCRGR